MWILEEMMVVVLIDGGVVIWGLDKVIVYVNLLFFFNVILWNYKVLWIVYEEMEYWFKVCMLILLVWYLDKFIIKFCFLGCLKRFEDGRYVCCLVLWFDLFVSFYEVLVYVKYEVLFWDSIDMVIIWVLVCYVILGCSEEGLEIFFDDVVESICWILFKM